MNQKKINPIKLNKRSVLINAGIAVFLISILIFSMLIYRFTEEGEERIVSNSYMTMLTNYEDSIQLAVKRMIKERQNMSLSNSIISVNSVNFQRIRINTTLSNNSNNSYGKANLSVDMMNLKTFVDANLNGVTFDNATLMNNLVIEADNHVRFYKEDRNATHGEKLVIYYNETGNNTFINIAKINITISSNEFFNNISWESTAAPDGDADINITIFNTRGTQPEDPADTFDDTFRITNSAVHNISINNATLEFLNISFDREKIVINNIYGESNVTVDILTEFCNCSRKFYINQKVINLTFSDLQLEKQARIEFI